MKEIFYNDLTQFVKNGIEKCRIQANEGKITPLEDVISQLKC